MTNRHAAVAANAVTSTTSLPGNSGLSFMTTDDGKLYFGQMTGDVAAVNPTTGVVSRWIVAESGQFTKLAPHVLVANLGARLIRLRTRARH